MSAYTAQVFRDAGSRPVLVFSKGRKLYHAVVADATVRLETFETLRDLLPLDLKGDPYPAKRAASFWLNHDHREITPRAKLVLRGLVARKPRTTKPCAEQQQNLAANS